LVPGDDSHYHFLAIDFGICRNESGELEPQLIELQAFPSLFGFQRQYEEDLRSVYPFLDTFKRRIPINDYIEMLGILLSETKIRRMLFCWKYSLNSKKQL
jgi:hypothetical protein